MKENRVFVSTLPGSWYPANPNELRGELDAARPVPEPAKGGGVCAAIVPHAGYRYSGRISAGVFARLDPKAYDRVIVVGPSHHRPIPNGVSIANASGYQTPLGTSPADTEWIARARALPGVAYVEEAHAREHSDQIQVPLIQHFLGLDKRLVCVVAGRFDPDARKAFAQRLKPLLDARTLVVASTDFTHFGPYYDYIPFAGHNITVAAKLRDLDEEVLNAFVSGDPGRFSEVLDVTGATVCGREVLALLLELLPSGARTVKTGYTTSGEIMQDWTNSVSYMGAVVEGAWRGNGGEAQRLGPEDGRILLGIAREVVTYAAERGTAPAADLFASRVTPALQRTMGGFVTLMLNGRLRGCIGEIVPMRPLWRVIHDHARNAAVSDFRFKPVRPDEVPLIEIEVSVLTPPEPVASWCEIEVGKHGVVLHKAGCTAVFLPQVATENNWDRPTMLRQLAIKAGLGPTDWMAGADFEVFEAQVFREIDEPRVSADYEKES